MDDPAARIALAALAMEHLRFAGLLAGLFSAVTIAWLVATWRLAGTLPPAMAFILYTLYLLWQSNIAFVAVIALLNGTQLARDAGTLMALWQYAPFMVPSAALLYTSVLCLSVLVVILRGRAGTAVPGAT